MIVLDALKSVVLATAVVDRRLSVEEAVALARMELEFQVGVFEITSIQLH